MLITSFSRKKDSRSRKISAAEIPRDSRRSRNPAAEKFHLFIIICEFDPEIERTLKALRAQGKITNTCEVKMAENPRALRDRTDEGKLPSHPIENPRANYHEQANAVITIRNGKLVDNKVGKPIKDSESNNNETEGISMTKIETKIEKELASSSNFKTLESSPTTSYKPKPLKY
ncbi:hypothetical protein M9H77_12719 [Catharanthus roseus]|uniref:Uncharacterized protein n=1 Tax=Catharanthus roseus TaxID=4058 RepID=A0ACC0BI75_CATRO|nr:hypothetical protein M9H77_12719 [Catharanthus roseus]